MTPPANYYYYYSCHRFGPSPTAQPFSNRVIPQEKSVIEIQLFLRNSMRIIPKD